MAVFGCFEHIKKQINIDKFNIAFSYLEKASRLSTAENLRLMSYPVGAFEKIQLTGGCFALEQVYKGRERTECFFESHRSYIDLQFIVCGEEFIELVDIGLTPFAPYDIEKDLLKYGLLPNVFSSKIILRKNDIGIFYPEDVHMPCLKKTDSESFIVKTVVKVPV